MNYILGFLLMAAAVLLFIMVANNSWLNIWDSIKSKEQQAQ